MSPIEDVLNGQKVNFLKCFVKKVLSENKYWIQDESSNCELEVTTKSKV